MGNDSHQELAALKRRVRELEAAIEALQQSRESDVSRIVDSLRGYRRSADGLERRLTILAGSIAGCNDQIAEMKRSRIWRTLVALGGVFLRIRDVLARTSDPAGSRTFSISRSKDVYWCDEPSDQKLIQTPVLTVRGWYLTKQPVTAVQVSLDHSQPVSARIGVLRPDIAKAYPTADGAGHSGYEATLNLPLLAEGFHEVSVGFYAGDRCLQVLRPRILSAGMYSLPDAGPRWLTPADDLDLLALAVSSSRARPCVSILMPVFNAAPEFLSRAVDSVLRQSYSEWELCIADDGSQKSTAALLDALASRDPRIRVTHHKQNGGIAAASNTCLAMASGEAVVLLDQDDELCPDALLRVVDCILRHPSYSLIYSDEDKINESGRSYDPFYKPDWSPDLLRAMNYVGHLVALPRSLISNLGGFRSAYDGSQDYDLVLRASESPGAIIHIPRVLYHWRSSSGSTAQDPNAKSYAHDAAARAIADHLTRSGESGSVENVAPGRFHVSYSTSVKPPVSIIIASGGRVPILSRNLDALVDHTRYESYELIIADNSRDDEVHSFVSKWSRNGRSARYFDWRRKPFNYSAINNAAARLCSSSILLFLNDDTEVIAPEWLEAMVQLISRPVVGAVGAKLLYPDGRLQHAGVSLGIFECCANSFQGVPPQNTYYNFADVVRNVTAVTGACLMTRADLFWSVGGFDEERFPIAFNDVDLCLKLGATGYRILYTPRAVLYHHEAYSKGWDQMTPTSAEVGFLREKWKVLIERDPFYSPHLTRERTDFSYAM